MKFSSKTKHILAAMLGFGLGGLIWGWGAYSFLGKSDTAGFDIPFLIDFGAIPLGIFGGLGLTIFSKDIKKILKVIVLGTIGWAVGFSIAGIFSYYLFLFGGILGPFFAILDYFLNINLISFLNLEPSLRVGHLWLGFLIAGFLVSLIYALLFQKQNKIKIILFCSFVLAISSLISPIIGNLIGDYVFHSLFVSYLITFILISISFGLALFKFLGIKNES